MLGRSATLIKKIYRKQTRRQKYRGEVRGGTENICIIFQNRVMKDPVGLSGNFSPRRPGDEGELESDIWKWVFVTGDR